MDDMDYRIAKSLAQQAITQYGLVDAATRIKEVYGQDETGRGSQILDAIHDIRMDVARRQYPGRFIHPGTYLPC